MPYIDGFISAVPTANKQAFIDHAHFIDPLFKELGATRVVECWGDDIPEGNQTDFYKAVKAASGESVAFSWVEWPDKETRDQGVARMHEMAETDERFDESQHPVPFDGNRMIFGGFELLLEI